VIGLGFMGATHLAAYQAAANAGLPCAVVAVCDRKAGRRAGELGDVSGNINVAGRSSRAFDPAVVRGYERADELIADPDIDLVSICTRTDTHVDLCLNALAAGKHVLVEKPVALGVEDIDRIAAAARAAKRVCMPAMCLRYWPGWAYLQQRVNDRMFGACRSATFHRLAPPPSWSQHFFLDAGQSGGALLDLHIHDADFVLFCFGKPDAVSAIGRETPRGGVEHLTALYRYAPGKGPPHVVAEGGWDHTPGFNWRMRYVAVFDDATLDYDVHRNEPLLLCREGNVDAVTLDAATGYDLQVRALVSAIAAGVTAGLPGLDDAAAVTRMLLAERESVRTGQTVPL
jgi:predicted dehydrogenase